MAETRDPRNNDSRLPRATPQDLGGTGLGAPVEQRRGRSRSKKDSWFQDNHTMVIGIGAGVVLLVLVLVFGWLFGWFGGGGGTNASPAIAQNGLPPQPPPPPMQPMPPGGPIPGEPQPGQPMPGEQMPGMPLGPEPPKEEPQVPPLPENVADWNKEDYFRARRENIPKLIEAVVWLGEKYPNSTSVAGGLIDLLKPLPPEPPPSETSAAAGDVPPSGMPVAPPSQPAPPGAAQPAPGMPGVPAPVQPRPVAPPGMMPGNMPGQMPPGMGIPAMPGMMMPGHSYNPTELTKLVETIVEALGANGCELARTTLEKILAGTFETDDDRAAVEATLKTLVFHPRKEYDALLLRVLSAPSALRPSSPQGGWTAKEMQAKAFELITVSASAELRTKLADALVAARARIDPQNPNGGFLLTCDPANCGAQLVFYEKGNVKNEFKTLLEQQFVVYSSMALARQLKVPTDVQVGGVGGMGMPMAPPRMGGFGMGGPGMPMPRNLMPRNPMPGMPMPGQAGGSPENPDKDKTVEVDPTAHVPGLLWSQAFRTLIESQVVEMKSFEKEPQLAMLAATFPMDSTRSMLLKTLRKNWYDGPKALETAGLTGQVVVDPGLLVVLKSLPRKDSQSMTQGLDSWFPKTPGRLARPGMAPGAGRLNDAAQKKFQAEQDWMDVSARLVSAWCKRFEAATAPKRDDAEGMNPSMGGFALAAEDDVDDSDKPAEAAASVKMPSGFELAPEARVVASQHVLLPDAAPADFSQAQPDVLEVYYFRAEEAARPKKAVGFYCRQAGTRVTDVKSLDRSLWIDKIGQGSQKDRRRSIDILISKSETAVVNVAEPNADDETDLIVEVLIVEIKDPSKN